MRTSCPLLLLACFVLPVGAGAQELSRVFKSVSESVCVIRTTSADIVGWPERKPVAVRGLGSGVLISDDGRVMTASHVVQTADDIEVVFPNGDKYGADVVASEPAADVALLQLRSAPRKATVAELGDSDRVEVGDRIFVVGAPLGISHTLTVGHVSARRQPRATVGLLSLAELLQTDAAINPGNSGGPMFDMKGRVVGIVSHVISQSGGYEGLGFAVSSNTAKELLLDEGAAWSGMEGYELDETMARLLNVPDGRRGVLVQRVATLSPADRAGLRPGTVEADIGGERLLLGGDIILSVQGIAIGAEDGRRRIRQSVSSCPKGGKIQLEVLRGGEVVPIQCERH
ncbi:MAG: trypsin-like peptidase domain-containing protein [Acidobacteriota bacterium]